MPKFDEYPTTSQLLAADTVLTFKDAAGAVKQISGTNLAASLKLLIDRALDVRVVSSATTLDEDDQFVIGNSASTFTITLPESTDNPGLPVFISNKGAGTVTVAATGSDTIFGESSIPLPQYSAYIFIPDGLGMWHGFSLSV